MYFYKIKKEICVGFIFPNVIQLKYHYEMKVNKTV